VLPEAIPYVLALERGEGGRVAAERVAG
jgi:hypothetical protein